MDRLHPVTFVPFIMSALWACSDDAQDKSHVPAPTSRFEAVAAKPRADDALSDFCDVHHEPGQGDKLALPTTDTKPSARAGGQWLNLWATWCKPCVEELPMIAKYQQSAKQNGTAVTVHFVSVDATADIVSNFRKQHPGMPETMRLTNSDDLAPYVERLGLGAQAGLPIHVFAGADGHIRCVRSGAVTESHLDTIAPLLR